MAKKAAKGVRKGPAKPPRPQAKAAMKARPKPRAAVPAKSPVKTPAKAPPKTPEQAQPPAPRPPVKLTLVPAPPAAEMVLPPGRGRQREAIRAETRTFPRMKTGAAPRGWIRIIREALGISQSQIAVRAGVSRATVQQWERAEARRRITLLSLDRVAHAMGCTLALAIVPKAGTLDDLRRRQARAKAIAIVKKEDAPEDPDSVTDLSAAQRRRIERIIARLLRGSPRRLWKQ